MSIFNPKSHQQRENEAYDEIDAALATMPQDHLTAHLANDPRWAVPLKETPAQKKARRRQAQTQSSDRRRTRHLGWDEMVG